MWQTLNAIAQRFFGSDQSRNAVPPASLDGVLPGVDSSFSPRLTEAVIHQFQTAIRDPTIRDPDYICLAVT